MCILVRKIQQQVYRFVLMVGGNVHAQVARGASISSCQVRHSILRALVGMFFKCQRSKHAIYIIIHIYHI